MVLQASPRRRTHHLHLVPTRSRRYCDEFAFRDALQAWPATAEAYLNLKRMLAREHTHGRDAYTAAKATSIADVLSVYA